ncbi:MAG: hypothetical protein QOI27_981 [Gaiellaceae bacterium]|nr:hypothetical protein [Gaiellaceae bacterium]
MTTAATLVAALMLAAGAQATVSPVAGQRDGLLDITVTDVRAPAVQVKIAGGAASLGKWFGWVPLVQTGPSSWHSVLRAPGFLGVYPLQVRTASKTVEAGPIVRILPPGFGKQPAFFTPAEVADWWARTSTAQGKLVGAAEWHSGLFTHRDPRFNRLVRATVELPGQPGTETMYVSVARLRADGPWRLLEAVPTP